MLIASKFHDYYDTALSSSGVDKTCVYKRKTIRIREANPFKGMLPRFISSKKTETLCTFFIVGFCGKLYVGARFENTLQASYKNKFKPFCVYGQEEIEKAMYNHRIKEPIMYYYYFRHTKKLKTMFNKFHDKANLELFFKYKVPVFSFVTKLKLNPVIKPLQFYKVFDTYSAFQEIHMFLSGVLGNPEKKTVRISDIDRLEAHGFDKKTSFRKGKKSKFK